jgi:hypothetical protein
MASMSDSAFRHQVPMNFGLLWKERAASLCRRSVDGSRDLAQGRDDPITQSAPAAVIE